MDELIDKIEGLVSWAKRQTDKQIVVNGYLENLNSNKNTLKGK
jgi:hypothetical protein